MIKIGQHIVHARAFLLVTTMASTLVLASGCNPSGQGQSSSSGTTVSLGTGSSGSSASGSSGSSGSVVTTPSSSSAVTTISAIQIIPKADSTGSFDAVAVPPAGGSAVRAARIFALDGSQIPTGNIPAWFGEARVFLTSSRTAGTANPVTPTTSNTPCAYFDSYTDNNPDTNGYYTIDGFNSDTTADVDQCAGAAATELNQLGMYVKVDRRFMNAGDRLQLIVKAKPIDQPNAAITPSSCVTGGYFDAAVCSNQLFTVSMRTAPLAPAKPFFFLFPTARALDLLSESVLLPISIDQSITTISIDRVKGGAIFYGFTLIRLQ